MTPLASSLSRIRVNEIRQRLQENDTNENRGTADIISLNIAIINADVNMNGYDELLLNFKYLKNEMLIAGCQVNEIMRKPLYKFLDHNGFTSLVDKILRAIYTTLEESHSRNKVDKSKDNVNTNNNNNHHNNNTDRKESKSTKSKTKAEKYVKYQRPSKKDRFELASEIFDGVENTASKLNVNDAYNHFKEVWEKERMEK